MEVGQREISALLDGLAPLSGKCVLEVGCGSGANLRMALDRGAMVWGVDTSTRQLRVARDVLPDANLRIGGIGDLPFDSNMFDAVYTIGVSWSAVRTAACVAELARVCRVGGVVAVASRKGETANRRVSELAPVASRSGLWPLPSPPSALISIKVCSQQTY